MQTSNPDPHLQVTGRVRVDPLTKSTFFETSPKKASRDFSRNPWSNSCFPCFPRLLEKSRKAARPCRCLLRLPVLLLFRHCAARAAAMPLCFSSASPGTHLTLLRNLRNPENFLCLSRAQIRSALCRFPFCFRQISHRFLRNLSDDFPCCCRRRISSCCVRFQKVPGNSSISFCVVPAPSDLLLFSPLIHSISKVLVRFEKPYKEIEVRCRILNPQI